MHRTFVFSATKQHDDVHIYTRVCDTFVIMMWYIRNHRRKDSKGLCNSVNGIFGGPCEPRFYRLYEKKVGLRFFFLLNYNSDLPNHYSYIVHSLLTLCDPKCLFCFILLLYHRCGYIRVEQLTNTTIVVTYYKLWMMDLSIVNQWSK